MSAPVFLAGVNLAEPRLGAEVVFASDDFFAAKERLIEPAEPVFAADKYDDHGKWMDGWESRRRRDGGHDHCIIRLGQPGWVEALEIDTRFFTGNYPPAAAVDGARCDARVPGEEVTWHPLAPRAPLNGDDRLMIAVDESGPWTHVRLRIFPDGGVARLRVFGRFDIDWSARDTEGAMDVAAIENGGYAIFCNDEHYGRLANILAPGRGLNMGDGWETRRRREPGHDFGVMGLGRPAVVGEILIDTAFFKGNFPHRCSLQAHAGPATDLEALASASEDWPFLLPEQPMAANCEHRFSSEILAHSAVRFVRLNLIPDGGVSRLRLFATK